MTTILITRPTGQQHDFTQRCQALGLTCLQLPSLCIRFLTDDHISQSLSRATGIVLFTSKNAVLSASRHKPFPWQGVEVHAIGKATANSLQSLSQSVSLIPAAPYNSEAYLKQISSRPKQQLLVIKGIGGRTLIHDHLLSQGWAVRQLEVYERSCPVIDQSAIDAVFDQGIPELVSITSDEALTNFLQMTPSVQPALFQSQLIVNSERCANAAMHQGFRLPPLVSKPPGDDGQILCLKRWLENNDS